MLGDGIAQKKVEGRQRLDLRRLLSTGLYAGCVVGPLGHGWFSALDIIVQRYGFCSAHLHMHLLNS
jgi:hypothetical protein